MELSKKSRTVGLNKEAIMTMLLTKKAWTVGLTKEDRVVRLGPWG